MKKDPKVFDLANRQNGNQTIKTERIGNEANSRSWILSKTNTL
jgi:hypothetical protein